MLGTVVGLFGPPKSIVKRARLVQVRAEYRGVNVGDVGKGNGWDVSGRGYLEAS